jgi:hypothetical protein
LAVREDDAEPELLDDEGAMLADGDVVAMAVKASQSLPPYLKPCPTSTPFLTFAFQSPGATVAVADIRWGPCYVG